MVLLLDVAAPHQRGCKHADGSSQVHDALTLLNLSHIQRVLRTECHQYLNTRIFASMITKPNQLDCGMSSQTPERAEARAK